MIERNHTETTRCLTDRWGQVLHLDPPATVEQVNLVESLLPVMFDEVSFIAEHDTRGPGILLETEYDDDIEPTAECEARLAAIAKDHPYTLAWFTQGGHVFCDRWAMRVFVPAEHCALGITENIGLRMLEGM